MAADLRFGRKLRSYLAKRDIPHYQFARAAGVSEGYLSKLVLRPRRNPSGDVIARIVLAFDDFGPDNALTLEEIRGLLAARLKSDDALPRAA